MCMFYIKCDILCKVDNEVLFVLKTRDYNNYICNFRYIDYEIKQLLRLKG